MRKLSTYLKTFLAAMLLLVGSTYAWAVDWASMGEVPVNGNEYVIYSTSAMRFLKIESSAQAKNQITANPSEAGAFTMEESDGKWNITYTENSTKKYVNVAQSTWGTTVRSWKLYQQADGTYHLMCNYTTGSYSYIYFMKASTTYYEKIEKYTVDDITDASCNFVFIPKATWNTYKGEVADWNTLGADITSSYTGKGVFYSPEERRFLTKTGATATTFDPTDAILVDINVSGTTITISRDDNGTTKYPTLTNSTFGWSTSSITYTLVDPSSVTFDETKKNFTNAFLLKNSSNQWWNVYSGTLSAVTYTKPYNTCQWLFIPEEALNLQKWTNVAGSVETEKEYYVYNVKQKRFLSATGLTDSWTAPVCLTAASGPQFTYNETDYTLEAASGTNQYYLKNGSNCLSAANATTVEQVAYADKDDKCTWLFIPKGSFSATIPAEEEIVEDEWTAKKVEAPADPGFYYLYNPVSKCFMSKNNSGTATPNADPAQAVMFYMSKQSENVYSFSCTHMAALKYVTTSTTFSTSSVNITLENDGRNCYRLKGTDNKYIFLTLSGNVYSLSYNASPTQFTTKWVLIPRSGYIDLTTPASPEADAWADERAVALSGANAEGLFYIYHPASKQFLGNKVMAATAAAATLFHVSKSDGKYTILYGTGDGATGNSVTPDNITWNFQEQYFSIAEKTSGSKRYVFYSDANKYLVVQKYNASLL